MGSPTTIHPFPDLRALAEEEARAVWGALAVEFTTRTGLPAISWDACPERDVPDSWAAAHLTLLCDLTRPMSRYAVSVLVGNRIGWDGHSVALSVETGGINIHALFRDCGFTAEPSLNAGVDLALIVRHLWPYHQPCDSQAHGLQPVTAALIADGWAVHPLPALTSAPEGHSGADPAAGVGVSSEVSDG